MTASKIILLCLQARSFVQPKNDHGVDRSAHWIRHTELDALCSAIAIQRKHLESTSRDDDEQDSFRSPLKMTLAHRFFEHGAAKSLLRGCCDDS